MEVRTESAEAIKQQILETLPVIIPAGSVTELRILKTSRGVQSGFFDNYETLAAAALVADGKVPGIYITLNPVKPELLERSSNRLTAHARVTTTDADIVRRIWLPIDFDPVRESGTSSTDAEHEAALDRARECREYLHTLGYTEPVFADSGNGAHLLYSIELANDPSATKLVGQCLKALDFRFSDNVVTVDTSVANAARIWKLYGTLSAKGANTVERPHRRSRIIEAPQTLVAVASDRLTILAEQLPVVPDNPTYPTLAAGEGGQSSDLGQWIAAQKVPITYSKPWNGGRLWVMQCPWKKEHTNKSAFLVQFEDGGVMARCHHDSCGGNGWPELRDIFEPGWRSKYPDADFKPVRVGPYRGTSQGMFWYKITAEGETAVPLTNFYATIKKDIVEDDGSESKRFYGVEMRQGNSLTEAMVPASEFESMSWVTQKFGAKAIIHAGNGNRDRVRAAIQSFSMDAEEEERYAHTGWRRVGHQQVYLHGNGAIGQPGLVQAIRVSLPNNLAHFQLGCAADLASTRMAVRTSLSFLSVAAQRITFPLYASIWRSALGKCDFSLFLAGRSGIGKSELAALAQQHFGAGFDARHLPGSWTSTANSLEVLAFAAKDALLVVDDFVPSGNQNDMSRLQRDAERIFRAQGNSSGRGRLGADATLRKVKPPRGLLLSTGEDIPKGHSLQSRLLTLEMRNEDLEWTKLTAAQHDAAAGIYVQAFTTFVLFVSLDYEAVQRSLKADITAFQQQATTSELHKRTPNIVANLAAGFKAFLRFASLCGFITEIEHENLWVQGWAALGEAALAQATQQTSQEPVDRFLALLGGAIASGQAHLATEEEEDTAYDPSDEDNSEPTYQTGQRIGWIRDDGEQTFQLLEPETAYAMAQRTATTQGEPMTISKNTLFKRMHERGMIARAEVGRNLAKWYIDDKQIRVLCLFDGTISG